jgi:uncharacterized protein (DUF488 family)
LKLLVNEKTIWTVGHSTRSFDELSRILKSADIQVIADARAFPSSRRHPQFNQEQFALALKEAGIDYHHFPSLGGRRVSLPDSRNTAWKNPSFRAYADYMETAEFRRGVESLLELARGKRVAIMCAEAVWWKCHRSLIADYLKAMGWKVIHFVSAGKSEEHPFTAAASIVEGKLSYEGLLRDAE